MNEIIDRLYLGAYGSTQDARLLKKKGIFHILNMCK